MARLEGARLILAVRDLRTATGDESDGWSWLSRDNVRVGLGECTDALPANEQGDHSDVAYVNVDDIDGLYHLLLASDLALIKAADNAALGERLDEVSERYLDEGVQRWLHRN